MDDDTLFGNWWAGDVRKIILGQSEITVANIAFRAGVKSAQQGVQRTAIACAVLGAFVGWIICRLVFGG